VSGTVLLCASAYTVTHTGMETHVRKGTVSVWARVRVLRVGCVCQLDGQGPSRPTYAGAHSSWKHTLDTIQSSTTACSLMSRQHLAPGDHIQAAESHAEMLLRACVAGGGGRGGRGTLESDMGSGCGRFCLERVESKALAHLRVAALADQLGGFLLGCGHLCDAQVEKCMHLFAAGAAVNELKLA